MNESNPGPRHQSDTDCAQSRMNGLQSRERGIVPRLSDTILLSELCAALLTHKAGYTTS